MKILEALQKFLEGRGIYPIFMFIFTWSNVLVLLLIIIFELLLYIFRFKYINPEFKAAVSMKIKKNKE